MHFPKVLKPDVGIVVREGASLDVRVVVKVLVIHPVIECAIVIARPVAVVVVVVQPENYGSY